MPSKGLFLFFVLALQPVSEWAWAIQAPRRPPKTADRLAVQLKGLAEHRSPVDKLDKLARIKQSTDRPGLDPAAAALLIELISLPQALDTIDIPKATARKIGKRNIAPISELSRSIHGDSAAQLQLLSFVRDSQALLDSDAPTESAAARLRRLFDHEFTTSQNKDVSTPSKIAPGRRLAVFLGSGVATAAIVGASNALGKNMLSRTADILVSHPSLLHSSTLKTAATSAGKGLKQMDETSIGALLNAASPLVVHHSTSWYAFGLVLSALTLIALLWICSGCILKGATTARVFAFAGVALRLCGILMHLSDTVLYGGVLDYIRIPHVGIASPGDMFLYAAWLAFTISALSLIGPEPSRKR